MKSGDLTPSSSCLEAAKLFACSFPLTSHIFSVFFRFSASLLLLGRLHASPRILQSSPSSPSSLQSHVKIFVLIGYQNIKNHRDTPPSRHFLVQKKDDFNSARCTTRLTQSDYIANLYRECLRCDTPAFLSKVRRTNQQTNRLKQTTNKQTDYA